MEFGGWGARVGVTGPGISVGPISAERAALERLGSLLARVAKRV